MLKALRSLTGLGGGGDEGGEGGGSNGSRKRSRTPRAEGDRCCTNVKQQKRQQENPERLRLMETQKDTTVNGHLSSLDTETKTDPDTSGAVCLIQDSPLRILKVGIGKDERIEIFF